MSETAGTTLPSVPSGRHLVPGWRAARRLVQVAFVALFLWLFRGTEYTDHDILGQPSDLFFRLDPLNALCAMLSSRTFIWTFWPALGTILLTLLFGRAFCGWICPLGTLLDWFHRLLRPLTRLANRPLARKIPGLRTVRYGVLIFVVLASLMAVPIVGYLDPFGLLMRGMSALDPVLYRWVSAGAHMENAPAWWMSAWQYVLDHAMPFQQAAYHLSGATLIIFATLFALEFVGRRFWCRYLCPLGAMLGLMGRWSLVRRLPTQNCGKCRAQVSCAASCRMGAFNDQGKLVVESCNLCMDCVADCPQSVAQFKVKKPRPAPAAIGLSRRGLLTAAAAGVAVPLVVRVSRAGAVKQESLPVRMLRPPGAIHGLGAAADKLDEDFLNLCIRCGECIKVCTTNGLQPGGVEAGWAAIFAPVLVPRTGYCQLACTLCGQVCPTGAIPLLTQEQKSQAIIGVAAFDRSRCLPWAKNEECLVCEEHCPLDEKAIRFDVVEVEIDGAKTQLQRPWVDQSKCIGCGFCENKCPLDGEAGIHVYRSDKAPKEGKRWRWRHQHGPHEGKTRAFSNSLRR